MTFPRLPAPWYPPLAMSKRRLIELVLIVLIIVVGLYRYLRIRENRAVAQAEAEAYRACAAYGLDGESTTVLILTLSKPGESREAFEQFFDAICEADPDRRVRCEACIEAVMAAAGKTEK